MSWCWESFGWLLVACTMISTWQNGAFWKPFTASTLPNRKTMQDCARLVGRFVHSFHIPTSAWIALARRLPGIGNEEKIGSRGTSLLVVVVFFLGTVSNSSWLVSRWTWDWYAWDRMQISYALVLYLQFLDFPLNFFRGFSLQRVLQFFFPLSEKRSHSSLGVSTYLTVLGIRWSREACNGDKWIQMAKQMQWVKKYKMIKKWFQGCPDTLKRHRFVFSILLTPNSPAWSPRTTRSRASAPVKSMADELGS